MKSSLIRRSVAEFIGTAFLLVAMVSSSILTTQLEPTVSLDRVLVHAFSVGVMLAALITLFAPISGAHFNPALSLVLVFRRSLPFYEFPFYLVAQITGAVLGVLLAQAMFNTFIGFDITKLAEISGVERVSEGELISEAIFTYVFILLLLAVMYHTPSQLAWVAGLYVSAAIICSPSGAFLNPAVVVGRTLTSAPVGISPSSVMGYVSVELVAALVAGGTLAWFMAGTKKP